MRPLSRRTIPALVSAIGPSTVARNVHQNPGVTEAIEAPSPRLVLTPPRRTVRTLDGVWFDGPTATVLDGDSAVPADTTTGETVLDQ